MCMFHKGKYQVSSSWQKGVYLSVLSCNTAHYKFYLSLAPGEFMKE